MSPFLILEIGSCELKQSVSSHKCQDVKISDNLAFDYLSKCEFKENVLRGRCQDANVNVKLAFGDQSKCIPLKLKH